MQTQNVAHGVVFIALGIALQGFRAIGERDTDDGLEAPGIALQVVYPGDFNYRDFYKRYKAS